MTDYQSEQLEKCKNTVADNLEKTADREDFIHYGYLYRYDNETVGKGKSKSERWHKIELTEAWPHQFGISKGLEFVDYPITRNRVIDAFDDY